MIFALSLFSVYGCSSGSSGESAEQGDITIGLTDAEGDFLSYTVDVTSITLTHANGNVVETLPTTTRVDFAQYVDMTEFLTAASVPLGAYKAATLHLDYSNAEIVVEDSEGDPKTVTSLVDTDGNAVTELDVDVFLANRSALVVAPGVTRHLTLDFDLEVSNTVEFEDGTPTVTVDPTLTAEVNHTNNKPYRVRGLLSDVDTEYSYFTVDVRPFYHNMKNAHHKFGQILVTTSDDTVFEIDGASLTGQDGLAALAGLESDTSVMVMGKMVHGEKNAIAATWVCAGGSVPGHDSDYVQGSVLSRDGNTLVVNGMVFIKDQGIYMMYESVIVTIDLETEVRKQASDDTVSIDDISPGQHVTIQGPITVNEDTQTPEMDATQGFILMNRTVLRGKVVEATADESTDDLEDAPVLTSDYFTVDLGNISMKSIELFDFTGTGSVSPDDDADPTFYEIETGDLDISDFETGDDIKVYGFPNAFGMAPYDFLATSVVNYVDQVSLIKLKWAPSTVEPFTSISEEELLVNADALKHFRFFKCKGPLFYDNSLEEGFTITPDDEGTFVILINHETEVFSDFSEFVSMLDTILDGVNRAKELFVAGTYDGSSSTLTAHYLTIIVH